MEGVTQCFSAVLERGERERALLGWVGLWGSAALGRIREWPWRGLERWEAGAGVLCGGALDLLREGSPGCSLDWIRWRALLWDCSSCCLLCAL